jgi:hypothetical protein
MTPAELIEATRNFLFRRQTAYRATFHSATGEEVLADLSRFCRAGKSTFSVDPSIAARLDGRREVWLRIQDHLQLTQEQLWKLQNGE